MKPAVDLRKPFLDSMPSHSREQLLLNSTTIRYSAGKIAFQPGDADRADILDTGFARIYLSSSDGRQTTIRYVHPGELMGGLLVMGAAFDGSVQLPKNGASIRPRAVQPAHETQRLKFLRRPCRQRLSTDPRWVTRCVVGAFARDGLAVRLSAHGSGHRILRPRSRSPGSRRMVRRRRPAYAR
jgi:CRP-like cAMP-binding protein